MAYRTARLLEILVLYVHFAPNMANMTLNSKYNQYYHENQRVSEQHFTNYRL